MELHASFSRYDAILTPLSDVHRSLVKKYCECVAVIMAPITPHWSEKIWSLVGGSGFVVKAPWPVVPAEDKLLTRQQKCLLSNLRTFRQQVGKAKKKPTAGKILVVDVYP